MSFLVILLEPLFKEVNVIHQSSNTFDFCMDKHMLNDTRKKLISRPEEQQSTNLPVQLLKPTDPIWKQASTKSLRSPVQQLEPWAMAEHSCDRTSSTRSMAHKILLERNYIILL